MPASMSTETLLAELEKVRKSHGEEAFQQARRDLAISLVLKPNGETFIKNAFPDMDLDELREQANKDAEALNDLGGGATPEQMMLNMLRAQVPNLKTQAHYNHFMACFDALRMTANAYFGRDEAAAAKGRKALDQALDVLAKIPEVEDQFAEMPDDAKSDRAKEFTQPAKELHEHDNQKRFLVELAAISDRATFNKWYKDNRPALDGIVSQRLRNQLFDAIRQKRKHYENQEAN